MKAYSILAALFTVLVSCTTANGIKHNNQKLWENPIPEKKNSLIKENKKTPSKGEEKASPNVKKILKDAKKYLGTPYKSAGNDENGFDCSGLVCRVFQENNISLPRSSAEQAKIGTLITIQQVRVGDLLFFATSGGDRVSHIGIVDEISPNGEIFFIHSSTTKGVIISSLNEKYWNKAFLFARRVIEK